MYKEHYKIDLSIISLGMMKDGDFFCTCTEIMATIDDDYLHMIPLKV